MRRKSKKNPDTVFGLLMPCGTMYKQDDPITNDDEGCLRRIKPVISARTKTKKKKGR